MKPSLSNLKPNEYVNFAIAENVTNVYSLLKQMNTSVPLTKDNNEVKLNHTEVRDFVLVNESKVELNKTMNGIKKSNLTSNIYEKGNNLRDRHIQKRSVADHYNTGSIHISRIDNDGTLLDQQNAHFNKSLTHAM